jgi:hypothetical protein
MRVDIIRNFMVGLESFTDNFKDLIIKFDMDILFN